jgi:formylglycine-generating enzyme required for sulfatase activity
MASPADPKKLSVFLCHAREDKPKVRELYAHLNSEAWIDPWLDEEKLLPGQEWNLEIVTAIRKAHVIIVCLSSQSVVKEGYVQKEINHALDVSEEMPERTIFIIPLLFDECDVPSRLKKYQYHWVGDSSVNTHPKLLRSLEIRASKLGVDTPAGPAVKKNDDKNLDTYFFKPITAEEVPYPFYLSKYPVTNAQYERFLDSSDFADESLWTGFSKFNEDGIQIGQWENEGLYWLQNGSKDWPNFINPPIPAYWEDKSFGIQNSDHPVIAITWYEASAYCKWLLKHWNEKEESSANLGIQPKQIRLPLEYEWIAAAGGETPEDRYPWDKDGKVTENDKEIARRANVHKNIEHTTAVNAYPRGASYPHKVMDMAGNVWEWQANFYDKQHKGMALRGGAWNYYQYGARVSRRYTYLPDDGGLNGVGFRVVFTV